MKNYLMTLTAVLCCALFSATFTACTTKTVYDGPLPDTTPVTSAKMECILKVSEESLLSFDFFVKYYEADGNVKSEKVVWTDVEKPSQSGKIIKQWTKMVTTALPSTLGLYFEMKPREDIDLSEPDKQHTYSFDEGVYISSVRQSGANYQIEQVLDGHTAVIKSSKIEGFANDPKKPGTFANIIVTFDKNGNITSKKEWQ